jgi:hypothetical protein
MLALPTFLMHVSLATNLCSLQSMAFSSLTLMTGYVDSATTQTQ